MRKNLLLFSFIPLLGCSQTILHKDINMPQTGDMIKMYRIVCPEMNTSCIDSIWDFSGSKILDEEMSMEYQTVKDSADQMVRIEPHSVTHYTEKDNRLQLSGYEMPHVTIHYQIPIDEMRFPFSYGDSITGFMQGTGRYCETIPFRIYGQYKQKGEACGTLILPEGDTLTNVLCTRFEQVLITEPLNDFSQLDTLKTLSGTEVLNNIQNAGSHSRIIIKKWYSEGYRYPFVEAYHFDQPQKQSKDIIYYCPSNEQKKVKNDYENQFKKVVCEGRTNYTSSIDMPYSYKLFQTNRQQLHFVYHLTSEANMSYGIYTTDGIVIYESGSLNCKEGAYDKTIDIPQTSNGILIFDLRVNNSHKTEKIVIE